MDEIAESLGVDRLIYLDREAMNEAARVGNRNISKFCNACFTGDYPLAVGDAQAKLAFEGVIA